MRVRGLVFDLFGTLVTRRQGPRAYRELILALDPSHWLAARELGLTAPIPTLSEFARRFPGGEGLDLASLEARLREDLEAVELFPETLATLAEARARGLGLALISNLAAPYKQPFYRLGLAPCFDAVVFSCEVGLAKPQAEIYGLAAAALGLDPGELLMVGDSHRDDVLGPQRAGLAALHLDRRGRGDIERLDQVFEHLG